MRVPSLRRDYTTAVNDAIRRTHTTFCEARALAEDGDAEPRLVASMTATLMAIYDRPGITH
jgi:hypothetical protein